MKKIFTLFAVLLMAFAVNAQSTPSTDFSSPYTCAGSAAVLDGNINYNVAGYLQFSSKVNGTATWTVHSEIGCVLSVTLNMTADKKSGHIIQVEVFDSEDKSIGVVGEGEYSESTTAKNIGCIFLPEEGDYRIVLSNNQSWSSATLSGITLTRVSTIPEVDFSSSYTCAGSAAGLVGNIWYNADGYLYYNDKSVCGTAFWPIQVTRGCHATVTLNMTANVTSGHNLQVAVVDLDNNIISSLSEGGWHNNTDAKTLDGTVIIPKAGIYKIVLTNSTAHSSATLSGITLAFPDPIFTVAGSSGPDSGDDDLFGTAWATDISANDMVVVNPENGLYVWRKRMTFAEDQTLKCKVVTNHTWDTSYPGFDVVINVPSAGTYVYEVTFKRDGDHAVNATVNGPEVTLSSNYTHALGGSTISLNAVSDYFGGDVTYAYSYKASGAAEFINLPSLEGANPSVTVPVATGSYEYKVVATCTSTSEEVSSTTTVHVASSWTIAGDDEMMSGVDWDPTNTDNDMSMTETNGVLTLEKNMVFIPAAATYYYKAYQDHVNDGVQVPASSNQNYAFSKAGYYNMKFNLNWKTWDVTLTATYVCPKVELMCGWNDWNPVEMVNQEGNTTCAVTVPLTAGAVGVRDFRVRINGSSSWNGNAGDGRMVRTSEAWPLDNTGAGDYYNCGLVVDVDGEYTFTFTYEGNLMAITYPMEFSRTVTNTDYGTICLPCAATLVGATAYSVDALHIVDGYITLAEVGTNLAAGVPYIIKPAAAGTITATMVGDAVASPVNNYLYGVWGATQTFDASHNVYAIYDNKLMLVTGTAEVNVASTRAYFKTNSAAAAPSLIRIVEGESGATNIHDVDGSDQIVKFIENGQLYILRDGITYDALGRIIK